MAGESAYSLKLKPRHRGSRKCDTRLVSLSTPIAVEVVSLGKLCEAQSAGELELMNNVRKFN